MERKEDIEYEGWAGKEYEEKRINRRRNKEGKKKKQIKKE